MVFIYPNVFQYFGFITKLNDEDYFVTQEFFCTKKELKDLLEKGEINSVERDYDAYEGFNRIKNIEMDSIK